VTDQEICVFFVSTHRMRFMHKFSCEIKGAFKLLKLSWKISPF